MGQRIRVVIADDHPIYREGIAQMVRECPELELLVECATGEQALAAIRDRQPDVAVLDLRLPDHDGIEILRRLRADGQTATRVLMLSASDDGASVYGSIAAGAGGYLVKDADRDAICAAVVDVAAGRTVLPLGLHMGLADEIRHHEAASTVRLSPREEEVLRLAANGCSSREIASRLIIGTATVKTHFQHIYEKLGVTDRAAAVAEGMRRGIVD
jgi:two-component system nitrate/nitrite response regulator NarL